MKKKQENPLPSYNRFKLNSPWLFSVKNFKISAYVYIICLLQLAFRKNVNNIFPIVLQGGNNFGESKVAFMLEKYSETTTKK